MPRNDDATVFLVALKDVVSFGGFHGYDSEYTMAARWVSGTCTRLESNETSGMTLSGGIRRYRPGFSYPRPCTNHETALLFEYRPIAEQGD